MKRVLITGATGFIGRQCLPLLLKSNYEVYAVSSDTCKFSELNIHWHLVDLLDPDQILKLIMRIRPTHLLHFAWYTEWGKVYTSVENFSWVQASLSLLQAFADHGGQRAIMAGTCAEYDWRYGYCSERTTPLSPDTVYGTCKHALQIMFESFTRQIGLSGAWGRIFFLYGPHEPIERLVSSVISSVLRGLPAECSHGNQIRDYLHVQDAARAFVSLLDSEVTGPVNVASGNPVALKHIIYKIADKIDGHDLIRFGSIPPHEKDIPLLTADIRRLFNEVGWRPEYDLDLGLGDTIRWWQNHLTINKMI